MKAHARAVVIGGGIVGVNILYHLARLGWSDVALLERRELTSGSTWHAAGLMSLYSTSFTFSRLYKSALALYPRLEEETGQAVGFHRCGTLRWASTSDRLDEYLHYKDFADTIGVRAEIVSPEEVKRLWPLVDRTDDLKGALYHPDDGHASPADVTQALAKGARKYGADIYRRTEVNGITRMSSGEWKIITTSGEIVCEHVIAATGSFARQTAAMIGLDVPVVPVVHQYLVTEEIPEIVERFKVGLPEMPVLRDDTIQGYIREERQGLMFGPYDQDPPLFAVDGMPPDYEGELLPPDYDATLPHFARAERRVPCLGRVGIRSCVSGPIAITPDNRPLVGPAWDARNFWLAEGFTGGVAIGGGIAQSLAEWIVNGEAAIDLHEVDPRRFGSFANKRYTRAKAKEAFANNFGVNYPDWEWPAARPGKTGPSYEKLKLRHAVFGTVYGWEVAAWFAPSKLEAEDRHSYRKSNSFDHVGNECRALRERVGMYDLTPAAKYEVAGAGAETWLGGFLNSPLPIRLGGSRLCYRLTASGGVECEFTVTRFANDCFYLVAATVAERHHFDTLLKAVPTDGSVTLRNLTSTLGAFAIAGPRARDVLATIVDADLSSAAFPWWSAKILTVGFGSDVRVLRVNYVGELGWELHHPIECQNMLFEAILEAGASHGLSLVGSRAVESLRLEKSYPAFWRDLNIEYTAIEAGLSRFIDPHWKAQHCNCREGGRRRLVVLQTTCGAADPYPYQNEAVYSSGQLVGRVTTGGYGHVIGSPLAHAYVDVPYDAEGRVLEIRALGESHLARVIPASPFDPTNRRPRA
jgi:dimethylglycine dehydrogenase